MNRDYDRSFLSDLVQELHRRISSLSIGADVIVGFPGETETDFGDTLDLIKRVQFDDFFSFKYSNRPQTPAATFSGAPYSFQDFEGHLVVDCLAGLARAFFEHILQR
jgi:tRNA-2-methylthio-N6-dimethylallyladenosine synthase